ncbi:glycosyltransferase family 4 protein [Patescibacteria group bacterium]|nr:glycosyltransferase family 4 protein [Patescibacteria group bacterium]
MKKKLKIAQVSPLWYPVPPKGYGGTELVVSRLTEELVKRGHKLTLFASANSKTKAKLISVVKKNLHSLRIPWLASSYNVLNLVEAFSQEKEFDIIHTHIDKFDLIFRHQSKVPTVATLHNPIWPISKKREDWHNYQAVLKTYNHFPKLPYIAISDAYQKKCPVKINFAKTIHNGIYPQEFKFNSKPDNYFIWFGRITRFKGPHLVIKIAKKLNLKLIIAGFCASQKTIDFFNKEIKPHLSKNIKFIGEIKSKKEKSELLGKAKALIYPLLWDEPFGIVMIESQACGTPVIAFNRGSVKEVMKNGETGLVVKNVNEMAQAIKKIDQIDRGKCRKWVEENFTVKKMIDEYEKAYYKIINKFSK